MAEAYGKLTGTPGHRLRHARSRRDQRGDRHSHGRAGFDADDRVRRPGRQRHGRSRSVPGNRLPADVRQRRQMGGADRSRRAHSRVRRARVSHRDVGPAGSGRARAARRHADVARDVRRCAARGGGASGARRRRTSPTAHALLAERARAARASSAAAAGIATRAPRSRGSPKRNGLPVACAFRHQDLFDNRHPHYAGDVGIGINPKLAARVRDADVLLVHRRAAGRDDDVAAIRCSTCPTPRQRSIHVHPGAGRARPRLPARDRHRGDARRVPRGDERDAAARAAAWRERAAAAHADYDAWRAPRPVPGDVDMWQIVPWLDERLPDDAILTNGAGNYTVWLHRLLPLSAAFARSSRRTPARWATACRPRSPPRPCIRDRIVVSWNGDGCFLMNGQELATAVQYGLAVDLRRHRQRHVRHDPHAPGAPLSRRGCRAPTSSIPISPRWRARTARTARPWCAPTNSRRRSSARWPPGGPRCCTSRSTRRR